MSKILFVHFNKYNRSSKFLFNEYALIWKKDRDFFFWQNCNDCVRMIDNKHGWTRRVYIDAHDVIRVM